MYVLIAWEGNQIHRVYGPAPDPTSGWTIAARIGREEETKHLTFSLHPLTDLTEQYQALSPTQEGL